MSDPKRDTLEEALAALPRDVRSSRDLWPQIRAEIEKTPIVTDSAPVVFRSSSRWFQLAAGVLLVLATSLTTYVATRQSLQDSAAQMARESMSAPIVTATPASFVMGGLGDDYFKARADLDKVFEQRMATLPPATRAKLERSLADLRQAAGEISATLTEHPSDPLLLELLMSTYQRELQLLADVSDMPTTTSTRTDL